MPQVPAVPITSGTPAAIRACIRARHSDFVAAREYFDCPAPRANGPLSVEPPSMQMMSGRAATPRASAARSNPNPSTPEGTSTRVVI